MFGRDLMFEQRPWCPSFIPPSHVLRFNLTRTCSSSSDTRTGPRLIKHGHVLVYSNKRTYSSKQISMQPHFPPINKRITLWKRKCDSSDKDGWQLLIYNINCVFFLGNRKKHLHTSKTLSYHTLRLISYIREPDTSSKVISLVSHFHYVSL